MGNKVSTNKISNSEVSTPNNDGNNSNKNEESKIHGAQKEPAAAAVAQSVDYQNIRNDQETSRYKNIADDGHGIVIALHQYTGRVKQELTYEKNQRFVILDKTDADWWYVRNLNTNEEGFVSTLLVVDENSTDAQEWYAGDISRPEAEKLLMKDLSGTTGVFLVRNSKGAHGLSLSVKMLMSNGRIKIFHYKIICTSNRFYIQTGYMFSTLVELIEYYKRPHQSNCCLLTKAYTKPKPQQWDLSKQTKNQWEIDRNELTLKGKLGSGFYGEVRHALWNDSVDVAVKTLKEGSMTVEDFLEEASIMKKLRHDNILILYAVCTDIQPIYIVTEFMNKGSLLSVLRKEGKDMVFPDLVEICSHVAAGMAYIEERNLIHRDLAARNVLMDSSKMCKIADFGLARILDAEQYSSTRSRFPVKWTAPESFSYSIYSIKSDVWSFGILMMEVMTLGEVPYPGIDNVDVADLVKRGMRMPRPLEPVSCPEDLYELMMKCWNNDPEIRPTFEFLSNYMMEYAVSSEAEYREIHPEEFLDKEAHDGKSSRSLAKIWWKRLEETLRLYGP